MKLALSQAKAALDLGEVPVGAVVVKDARVVAAAHNRKETRHDPTAHAEILALREAAARLKSWRLNDATLYVTLEPCVMCAGAIIQARVKKLVYGVPDPGAGAVDSLFNTLDHPKLNHRVEVVSGILDSECQALLEQFFSRARQK